MNERIQELALQASENYDYHPEFAKKFAELIVKECLKLLVTDEGNEKTSDAIWDLEELGVDVSKLLDDIEDEQ
jgi:hypothetical protein